MSESTLRVLFVRPPPRLGDVPDFHGKEVGEENTGLLSLWGRYFSRLANPLLFTPGTLPVPRGSTWGRPGPDRVW